MLRWIDADIADPGERPADSAAVQVEEAGAFEGVGDERDLSGVAGGEGVEMEDGEEEVLVGVCGVGFGRYALVVLG